jgi:hypothetical protein
VTLSERLWQFLIAIDQAANTAISLFIGDGWADETWSARCHREQRTKNIVVIDWFFLTFFNQPNHCRDAYESERLRRHLPPEYRQAH